MIDEIKENEVLKVPENQEQQQVPQTPASVRRYTRLIRPPEQLSPSRYYLLMTDDGEPQCYGEAMQVETKKKWEQDMDEDMDSLVRNHTWDLVEFRAGKRELQNKRIYKLKE